jgi:DNA-binding response OmpR family regulator
LALPLNESRRLVADKRTVGLIAELIAALHSVQHDEKVVQSRPKVRHRAGDIEIDEVYRTVTLAGKPVHLSPKAYEVLVALARSNGAPVPKAKLLEDIWKHRVELRSRTLDQHIYELRRKLEPGERKHQRIITIQKFGYALRMSKADRRQQ